MTRRRAESSLKIARSRNSAQRYSAPISEAVLNAVKHSGASVIRGTAVGTEHELTILVEDNGRGMVGADPEREHQGLEFMRQRAAAIGGWLEIGPASDGTGMLVKATLPGRQRPEPL